MTGKHPEARRVWSPWICACHALLAASLLSTGACTSTDSDGDLRCGPGTVREDNLCVVDDQSDASSETNSDAGASQDGGDISDSGSLVDSGDAGVGDDTDDGGTSPDCGASADSSSGTRVTPSDFGVDPGDDLAPAIDNLEDGATLVLDHQATYQLSDAGAVGVDDFTIAGNEATLQSSSHTILKLIGDNWEFKCVYFDQRGDRGDVQVWTGGADWDFHHVAWEGENSSSGYNPIWVASDPDSKNYIRNVWFGDGLASTGETAIIAFSGRPREAGHSDQNDGITVVENSFFREYGGIYGLMSADPNGYEGTFHVRSCYFENPYLNGPRIGHPDQTSIVEDSVIVTDDASAVPPTESGVVNSRGVWAWFGTVEIKNSHIHNTEYCALATRRKQGYAPTIDVTGGQITGQICDTSGTVDVGDDVGSNPRTQPLEATVTSAKEAVTGKE